MNTCLIYHLHQKTICNTEGGHSRQIWLCSLFTQTKTSPAIDSFSPCEQTIGNGGVTGADCDETGFIIQVSAILDSISMEHSGSWWKWWVSDFNHRTLRRTWSRDHYVKNVTPTHEEDGDTGIPQLVLIFNYLTVSVTFKIHIVNVGGTSAMW